MTIQIELTAEEEAVLRERAAQQGRAVEELAGEAVRSLVQEYRDQAAPQLARVVDERGGFRAERWEAVMASIARGSVHAPVLPPEALTRAAMYDDHD